MNSLQKLKRTTNLGEGLKLWAWIDADHATYPDTRRLVSRAMLMLGGGAISEVLQAQKVTTAATSESEYIALAEIVNKVRFLRQVTTFMMSPLEYSIKVHEDNEGAINMAGNRFGSRRVRHIGV